ncbi:hypothetical protein Tco_0347330 [Tanacetum coccineum]
MYTMSELDVADSEEFVNVFVRIGFSSTIELVFFDKSQVVTFNRKFICGFRNSDCGTRSRSDNMVSSPHGFIIHGLKIFKDNEKVTEVVDVKNWRVDNSRVLRWVVSLIEWNSSVSSMKSLIQRCGVFGVLVDDLDGIDEDLLVRPNGDALRKCILEGLYKLTTVIILVVPAIDDTLDEIYSTVDAYKIAHEMWIAIERLQQGESLNIQDVNTNLFWEFRKFTSHDGESMESYYSRFYKMMNEMIRNNLTVATMQVNVQFLQQLQPKWSRFMTIIKQQYDLDTVSYHKLFDVLKQYQKEVNEIHAKRIAKNANPLALVVATLPHPNPYYQRQRDSQTNHTSI